MTKDKLHFYAFRALREMHLNTLARARVRESVAHELMNASGFPSGNRSHNCKMGIVPRTIRQGHPPSMKQHKLNTTKGLSLILTFITGAQSRAAPRQHN
jgi:hypothetical protein